MDYTVEFHDLITDIAFNPSIKLTQVEFVRAGGYGTVNPDTKVVYPEVVGMIVHCHLNEKPGVGRELLEQLETALYLAEEIMTGLVAKTQCYCYLSRPITCTYEEKKYRLEGSYWEEIDPNASVMRAGEVFLDDVSFLDEPKNFHPMYHFYRAAKDEANTNDYRALNAWRFLEALHGKSDSALKKYLINDEKQAEDIINNFYSNVRCAIAHAKMIKTDPTTDDVILPRSDETEFNGTLVLDLIKIIEYLDSVVNKLNPNVTDIRR